MTPTVLDPIATGSQYEVPKPGARFLAVDLGLTYRGSAPLSSDADLDASVIGTDGQTYRPAFDEAAGCTDFDSGDYTLAHDTSETGCVVFELPDGVKVRAVQFGLLLNVEARWS